MLDIWFTATDKFNSASGEKWVNYIEWSKLNHLKEIISLDQSYRRWELIESDWEYNIKEDYLITYFKNLDYVVHRFSHMLNKMNILAIALEPTCEVRDSFTDGRFEFQGYDLTGKGDVSAITNCGGFDNVFKASDISDVGLFKSFDFTKRIKKELLIQYPYEYHADCELWAIWKMTSF